MLRPFQPLPHAFRLPWPAMLAPVQLQVTHLLLKLRRNLHKFKVDLRMDANTVDCPLLRALQSAAQRLGDDPSVAPEAKAILLQNKIKVQPTIAQCQVAQCGEFRPYLT